MSLRRVMGLLLLVTISTSSVEVLFGLESSLAGAESHLIVVQAGTDALIPSPEVDEEDCACLCACLCSGSQLVVGPPETANTPTMSVSEPPAVGDVRSPNLPSPRPPHRPPLA